MSTKILNAPFSKAAQLTNRSTKKVSLQSPWLGYMPDLAIPGIGPSGLVECKALVVVAGVLYPDHGWARIGPDNLPLGNSNGLIGYENGNPGPIINYGSGVLNAGSFIDEVVQPIRHVTTLQRFTAAAGLGVPEIIVITADTNGPDSGLGVHETGHLFRYVGGSWVSAEFVAPNSVAPAATAPFQQVAGEAPLSGGIDDWVDSTVYPLGITGGTTNGGVNDIQPVNESVLLFTNYRDQVMYFPCGNGVGYNTSYSSFRTYATQVQETGLLGDFYTGIGTHTMSFRCKTLATFDGRVWYGNTVEDGVFFATRLRRSIVGNPLIINSGFEIADATLNLNGVGAGFIDMEQFKTPIQRVLPLGDLLAVYSKDGVAVVRRTGSQAAPYAIQYITLERGVLAPGSVVPINPAQHFAILSDGWYLINANGTLQEVGISKPGALQSGEINYKWKEDFYTRLNQTGTDNGHLQTGYEPEEQFVRISCPMSGGGTWVDNTDPNPASHVIANEVWIYDLKNDRVFLDYYQGIGGQDESPVCWGVVIRPLGEFVSWADITGGTATPWNALDDPGTWSSLSPSFGGSIVVHGDVNGCPYVHDHAISTRDGDLPAWHFKTVPHNFKIPGSGERMLQRIDLQYRNNEASTSIDAQVVVSSFSNDNGDGTTARTQESSVINLRRGDSDEMAHDYAHFKATGDHHQVEMSGTGGINIHSIDLEFQLLEGRYRRREGT